MLGPSGEAAAEHHGNDEAKVGPNDGRHARNRTFNDSFAQVAPSQPTASPPLTIHIL